MEFVEFVNHFQVNDSMCKNLNHGHFVHSTLSDPLAIKSVIERIKSRMLV